MRKKKSKTQVKAHYEYNERIKKLTYRLRHLFWLILAPLLATLVVRIMADSHIVQSLIPSMVFIPVFVFVRLLGIDFQLVYSPSSFGIADKHGGLFGAFIPSGSGVHSYSFMDYIQLKLQGINKGATEVVNSIGSKPTLDNSLVDKQNLHAYSKLAHEGSTTGLNKTVTFADGHNVTMFGLEQIKYIIFVIIVIYFLITLCQHLLVSRSYYGKFLSLPDYLDLLTQHPEQLETNRPFHNFMVGIKAVLHIPTDRS